MIDEVKKNLPKLSSENKSYLKEFGLNDEMIKLILKKNAVEEFKILNEVIDNPDLIAKAITLFRTEIAKKEEKSLEEAEEILDVHMIERILENVGSKISQNDVKNVMQKIVQGKSFEEAIEKSEIDLSQEIRKLIDEKPGLSKGAYMGLVMGKFKGKVSGKEVSDELDKIIS
jgi:Glu-tRNA(Gln) amidotransferase subunit E-like FAD-binding protein